MERNIPETNQHEQIVNRNRTVTKLTKIYVKPFFTSEIRDYVTHLILKMVCENIIINKPTSCRLPILQLYFLLITYSITHLANWPSLLKSKNNAFMSKENPITLLRLRRDKL